MTTTDKLSLSAENDVSIETKLTELKAYVSTAAENGQAAHEVEKNLYKEVLALGGQLLKHFFDAQGSGDLGEEIELKNGEKVKRLSKLRKRMYRSILGNIEIERTVYAKREGGKIAFVPLDARLSLPISEQSHVLQEMSQYLSMEMSYRHTKTFLENILPMSTTVDTMERVTGQNSQYVEDYRHSQPDIDSAEEGEVIVVTSDAKGIPIKSQSTTDKLDKITSHQRNKKGPKPNTKRMAVVGGIYSIDRHIRTADELIESLFEPRCSNDSDCNSQAEQLKRPRPKHKRLAAFLDSEEKVKVPLNAASQTFDYLKNQYDRRDTDKKKEVVFLMDGQKSLWNKKKQFFGKHAGTEILDLIHVNGYLWDIAKVLYPNEEKQQLIFMKERVLRILQGKAGRVIGGIRQIATKLKLKKEKVEAVNSACNYLENNKSRMQYDEYLAKGYPIATGVIEGACRHYIKDRMERSGMRWVMPSAQAMLHLRSVFINEDWDDFTAFKIKKETEFLYQDKNILETVEWPMAA